jgi:hypothetical protein
MTIHVDSIQPTCEEGFAGLETAFKSMTSLEKLVFSMSNNNEESDVFSKANAEALKNALSPIARGQIYEHDEDTATTASDESSESEKEMWISKLERKPSLRRALAAADKYRLNIHYPEVLGLAGKVFVRYILDKVIGSRVVIQSETTEMKSFVHRIDLAIEVAYLANKLVGTSPAPESGSKLDLAIQASPDAVDGFLNSQDINGAKIILGDLSALLPENEEDLESHPSTFLHRFLRWW